jgi:hypothetical protein
LACNNSPIGEQRRAQIVRFEQMAGKLARPRMIDLFNAIRDKAREAGSEAAGLKKEVRELLQEADDIRSGKAKPEIPACPLRRPERIPPG